ARQPARRSRIDGRAIMRVDAGDAEEELVANRLADDVGAGLEQAAHRGRGGYRWFLIREPSRIAGAGALAGDVEHVLDRRTQPGQRPGAAAAQDRSQIVR